MAKALFEAGFPQDFDDASYFYDEQGEKTVRYAEVSFPRVGSYRLPSLAALIEACGDTFKALTREGSIWRANEIEADSPESAVAQLWLLYCAAPTT
jgi:hypothetical protein